MSLLVVLLFKWAMTDVCARESVGKSHHKGDEDHLRREIFWKRSS